MVNIVDARDFIIFAIIDTQAKRMHSIDGDGDGDGDGGNGSGGGGDNK